MNYTEAKTELEEILGQIESEEVELDVLSEKVKRACELIEFCRVKLKGTEEQVNSILEKFESKSQNGKADGQANEL